jgi:hypothetical protein
MRFPGEEQVVLLLVALSFDGTGVFVVLKSASMTATEEPVAQATCRAVD